MQKWNQVNKRLKTIIADGLDIAFNHSPLVKKTSRAEYMVSFFYIKFDGEIIWQYPKDNAYHNFRFCDKYESYSEWYRPWQGGEPKRWRTYKQFASPENIIAGYLDMPKDKLLEFDEPTGLRYILWACDKRIGKNKLSQMEFIKQALPIVKLRVPDYNLEPCLGNSMTLVYSDEEINIFGKSKWAFNATWHDTYFNIHRFVIADNPSYSLSKHAVYINDEYSPFKWLAWIRDNKIRLIHQDYRNKDVETVFDILVNKNYFYDACNNMISKMQKYADADQKRYDEYVKMKYGK